MNIKLTRKQAKILGEVLASSLIQAMPALKPEDFKLIVQIMSKLTSAQVHSDKQMELIKDEE